MGGKSDVGKTEIMVAIAEWLGDNGDPFSLLDCDTENKSQGDAAPVLSRQSAKNCPLRSRGAAI